MGAGLVILIVVIILLVILVAVAIGMYNGLVRMRNNAREAWAQIDTQLQRRADLIPNLVETVKGYAKHESETLQRVTDARTAAQRAHETGEVRDAKAAESAYKDAMVRVNAVAEQYPDLKASRNFLSLQEELATTENKVSFARQHYNEAVNSYNTKREVFPSNIFAGMFNFTAAELFEVEDESARRAPGVQF
ncbi:MAG TPA: LemA family protein [Dietzia timorensis]|uniref:LemA family protein n=1 Tax=Dietzia timorensis TaxID=499555 RepID=A0A921F458_9ACTN|nr:LemA family protein [Dietzia timorensis]HJE91150.1 LemA family protein [Dietzia timorensis]